MIRYQCVIRVQDGATFHDIIDESCAHWGLMPDYTFLEDKYGEWILYNPQFNKNTYFLWLLPILIFLAGGAIIFKRYIFQKN